MDMTPQDYSNLWYLRFEYRWVDRLKLDKDWREISKVLMKNSLLDYSLANNEETAEPTEIYKLKETQCR